MEGLVRQQEASREASVNAADEVEIGESLFAAWELVKSGDLDGALEKGEQMLRSYPDSASIHWLVASTYERKADREFARGNTEAGRELLKRAVAQYEGIIDLNPDSAADREKLAALRRRLSGGVADGQWAGSAPTGFRAALASVPRPLMAALVAFLVIVFVVIVLMPGSGREREPRGLKHPTKAPVPTSSGPTITRNAPSAPPSSSLSVYGYPATSSPPTSVPAVSSPVRPRQPQAATSSGGFARASSMPVPELTIVPVPRKTTSTAPKTNAPAVRPRPVEAKGGASAGSRMLAEAIQMHDQGLDEESIGTAERAIKLFQADIDAGRNSESAKRGIENAKKLIAIWSQSAASPGD